MVKNHFIKLAMAASFGATAALAGAPAVLAQNNNNNGNSNPGNNITICHATGSQTNPYVQISPNANGVISGHVNHQDSRDIIPAFDYNDNGTMKHFAGQNTDAASVAILNNGCKVAAGQGAGQTSTLGAQTGGQQLAGTPAGGVGAGMGGVTTVSAGAVAGIIASLGSLGFGLRRLSKF